MALLRFLGALAFLLLQVARCNLLDSRDYALGPGEIKPIPDIKYERPDDVCCWAVGTCPAGYDCNTVCQCVPNGASCCSNGRSCEKGNQCCRLGGCVPDRGQCCSNGQACDTGNICVIQESTGRYGCCTDLSCTAYVESGNTIPLTPSTPQTTAAPPRTTSPPDVVYEYYYWTITWYYYFYYFTYYVEIEASTLTSSEVTTTTTISVYATGSADADASLTHLSDQVVSSTPASATTALALSTDVIGATNTTVPTDPIETSLPNGDPTNGDSGGGSKGGDQDGGARPRASLSVWVIMMTVFVVAAGMVLL